MLNLPAKPFPVIQKFLHENKLVVYKYLVKQVRKGIREDLDKVELFQITPMHSHQKHTAVVKKEDYETVLQDAMKQANMLLERILIFGMIKNLMFVGLDHILGFLTVG